MNESYNQYIGYTNIERHMKIAIELFELEQKGHNLYNELLEKKCKMGKKNSELNVQNILFVLIKLIKPNKFCTNYYASLQYYLDELLFIDSKEIDLFVIEDKKYPLKDIYFNSNWKQEIENHPKLDNIDYLNNEEMMLFLCYFETYADFLQRLKNLIYIEYNTLVENNSKIVNKIKLILKKINLVLITIIKYILTEIKENFEKKIEIYLK